MWQHWEGMKKTFHTHTHTLTVIILQQDSQDLAAVQLVSVKRHLRLGADGERETEIQTSRSRAEREGPSEDEKVLSKWSVCFQSLAYYFLTPRS